jgi:hypothetical protein
MRIIAAAASSSFEVKCLYRLFVDRHQVEALLGQQPIHRRHDRVFASAQHLFTERHLGHAAILGAPGCIPTPESLCD